MSACVDYAGRHRSIFIALDLCLKELISLFSGSRSFSTVFQCDVSCYELELPHRNQNVRYSEAAVNFATVQWPKYYAGVLVQFPVIEEK